MKPSSQRQRTTKQQDLIPKKEKKSTVTSELHQKQGSSISPSSQEKLNGEQHCIKTTKKNASAVKRITSILPILVMIDMFAVSLIVPLLHEYFRLAGVNSAQQREFLSSLYSTSQILGGLILGAVSDSFSNKNTLLLSFLGSAVSYGLILLGGFPSLVISRVLIGFVKQTMTVSSAMSAMLYSKEQSEDRTALIGRNKASSTIAWIVGPSVGGFLYKSIGPSAPAALACASFVFLFVVGFFFLPDDPTHIHKVDSTNKKEHKKEADSSSKTMKLLANLKYCCTSPKLVYAILCHLLFTWVTRATSYKSMASYYEERYGMQPYQRGYLSSYQGVMAFLIQSFCVQPLLQQSGGERNAAFLASIALASATFLEIHSSFAVFLILLTPIISASVTLLDLSLRSLVMHVTPSNSLGSVLAVLDVLHNVAAVTVPFYRAMLFAVMTTEFCGGFDDDNRVLCSMEGDPSPSYWLLSSTLHWIAMALVLYYLLIFHRQKEKKKEEKAHNK